MTQLSTPSDRETRAPGRGFWPMRDIPTVVWLLLTVVAAVAHRDLPAPRWLMIHLLLLGAVTHAILVWSQYFSFALLRSAATIADRKQQNLRLILANGGAVLVFVGVLGRMWPVTVAGATALIVAVGWHGISMYRRSRRALPGRFGRTIRYYIAAAALLAIGSALGAIIARGDAAEQLVLSHALINVLGWIGLTVAGTVVTLWPTILRTRADGFAATGAARALPALAAGVVAAAAGAALLWLPLLALGLAAYLVGLAVIGLSLWRATRQRPPHTFAAMSVGMALLWWAGSVAVIMVGTIVAFIDAGGIAGAFAGSAGDGIESTAFESTGFTQVRDLIDQVVPYLVAGFAAQVLIGALSYLVPVVLGGGPSPVRVGTLAFDRLGPARVAVANTALAVCALPVSSLVRVVASVLYLIAMASFLPILTVAMRAQRRAKAAAAQPGGRVIPLGAEDDATRGRRTGQAMAGLIAVALAASVCVAIDPMTPGWSATPSGPADAPVVTVQVEAADMRFTPSRIEVEAGSRLVIELTNTDAAQVHDLVLANGIRSPRLAPGESATIDAGVISADLEAWCSIVGHRQMGMTLDIVAIGGNGESDAAGTGTPTDDGHAGHTGHEGTAGMLDLSLPPGAGFTPFDPVLPVLPADEGPVLHELTLTARDVELEVAPGVTQTLWTYNGTAPGPTLHGRVGDRFEITLINEGTMGHSIDFHASALAPDGPMRTIAPGEQLTYSFTATRAGIWMYHCSTMPMTAHIANGMYGAVVIEPRDLPPVDRSYVLVQGEYYLGDHDGGEVDMDKIMAGTPDLVVFNGHANQYLHAPLTARVGERVRVWVLDAGIERPSSFHIVGGQFDTVWSEGRYLINRVTDTGSQALGLMPAQGGFVELVFPEAGHYPFVSHLMTDAERGASGIVHVSG